MAKSDKVLVDNKPDPDVIQAALQRLGAQPAEALMIGDTAYDIEAATRAAVQTIAFRSSGWRDQDLRGAIALYDGPGDLLAHYQESPLGMEKVHG